MPTWTRAGLRAIGMDAAALQRALRAGELVRVGRDRYAAPGTAVTADPATSGDVGAFDFATGPIEMGRLAAPVGSGVALASLAAARAWGLPAPDAPVRVLLRRGCRRPCLPPDVTVRTTRRWQVVERDGVLVTELGRTCIDVARDEPLELSVPVLDAALRAGLEAADVLADLGPGTAGNARVRRAWALADARAESPLESRLRLLLVLAGLPPTDVQHVVRDGGRFVARVDLWYPGVVVEADGYAFHSGREDFRRDRRKGQAYARLGLLVLRFSWEDVVGAPREVVGAVRAAVLAAAAASLPPGTARPRQRPRRRRIGSGDSAGAA